MGLRRLGESGPAVSAIGLGCMGMSDFYGVRDEAEAVAVIQHALDRGITPPDTADRHGYGRNKELVGRAIHGRQQQVFLATKFGIVRDQVRPGSPSHSPRLMPGRSDPYQRSRLSWASWRAPIPS